MKKANEEREWSMIKVLCKSTDEFSADNIKKMESPDFLIDKQGNTVGVEVTTAMNPNHANNTPLAAIRGEQEKCLSMVYQRLAASNIPLVQFRVKFIDHIPINADRTANELFNFIERIFPHIDDSGSWPFYKSGIRNVEWLMVHMGTSNGMPWLNNHWVGRLHGPFLVNQHPHGIIQAAIDSKKNKLGEYLKNCDECWLIVGQEEFTEPEAMTIVEEKDYIYDFTGFSRAFFVRSIEGSVVELINQTQSTN